MPFREREASELGRINSRDVASFVARSERQPGHFPDAAGNVRKSL